MDGLGDENNGSEDVEDETDNENDKDDEDNEDNKDNEDDEDNYKNASNVLGSAWNMVAPTPSSSIISKAFLTTMVNSQPYETGLDSTALVPTQSLEINPRYSKNGHADYITPRQFDQLNGRIAELQNSIRRPIPDTILKKEVDEHVRMPGTSYTSYSVGFESHQLPSNESPYLSTTPGLQKPLDMSEPARPGEEVFKNNDSGDPGPQKAPSIPINYTTGAVRLLKVGPAWEVVQDSPHSYSTMNSYATIQDYSLKMPLPHYTTPQNPPHKCYRATQIPNLPVEQIPVITPSYYPPPPGLLSIPQQSTLPLQTSHAFPASFWRNDTIIAFIYWWQTEGYELFPA